MPSAKLFPIMGKEKYMKIKSILFIVALASITSVYADEYVCKVYCENTSGPKEYVTVKADSASEAAKIVDQQGHQICRDSGHSKASDATVSPSQCSRK